MAVKKPERDSGFLDNSGIRECRHYARFLNIRNIPTPDYTYFSTSEICSSINTILVQTHANIDLRERLIQEMISFKDAEIIPNNEFKWIEKDERACYWAWGNLRLSTHQTLNSLANDDFKSPLAFFKKPYEELNLNKTPIDTSERFKLIVNFFDRLDRPKPSKLAIIERLKADWTSVFNKIKPFKWLDKNNEDQLAWAWSYLMKENLPLWFTQPANNYERYLAIIAVFDIWEAHEDTKKLFSININKAWSQKKFRDQVKDRKPLNTYLEKDTKQKLEKLSKNYNLNITRTLEKIINEEYERYQKSTL